jgi:hypothetical protein
MSEPITLYIGEKRNLEITLTTSGLSAEGFTGVPEVTAVTERGRVNVSAGEDDALLSDDVGEDPGVTDGVVDFWTELLGPTFRQGRYIVTASCEHSSGETAVENLTVIVQRR